MIHVAIDSVLPDVAVALSRDAMETLLDALASVAHAKWIRLAQTELGSSSSDYAGQIGEVQVQPGMRTITLSGDGTRGWLANAIEGGLAPYDMRLTLLGEKAKMRHPMKNGGWYMNVPFRHMVPGSRRGQAMGGAYGGEKTMGGAWSEGAVAELGKAIYEAAKALRERTQSSPGGAGVWKQGATQEAKDKRLPAGVGGVGLLRPHHTTDIYAGMMRVRQTYKSAEQSQYTTFRRISSNSSPDKWQHPGIQARHLAQKVIEHVRAYAPVAAQQLVEIALTGGVKHAVGGAP